MDTHVTIDLVPDACTLPTAERPLRVAEFDALFATSLREIGRPAQNKLTLVMDGSADVEATARDLAARETLCCSFFTFTITRPDAARLQVDIDVPHAQVGVLDALARRAAAARRAT